MTSEPTPSPGLRREVRITRLFRAPRDLVFKAWIDPDQVAAWWAPKHCEIPRDTVEIEAHVGGRIAFSMVELAGGAVYPVRFKIVEISEPELLVLASDPQPEIGLVYPMITRAAFETEADGTRVTLTQSPPPRRPKTARRPDGQRRSTSSKSFYAPDDPPAATALRAALNGCGRPSGRCGGSRWVFGSSVAQKWAKPNEGRVRRSLSSGDASGRLRCRFQRLGFRLQERVGYPVAESQEAGSGQC